MSERCTTPRSCLYQCEQCGTQEQVPSDVIAYFDAVDPGGPTCSSKVGAKVDCKGVNLKLPPPIPEGCKKSY